jgi:hypothetical protein
MAIMTVGIFQTLLNILTIITEDMYTSNYDSNTYKNKEKLFEHPKIQKISILNLCRCLTFCPNFHILIFVKRKWTGTILYF